MLNQVRPRPDDAHVAAQHVPKLRDLVDAQFAKPFSKRINALVAIARLPGQLPLIGAHGAELVDLELSILHAGAGLDVKKRSGRLETLRQPNHRSADRKNHQHERNSDGQIECPFQETIERVLERFLAQSDESEPVVLEMGHRMAQPFLEITDNEQANAQLVTDPDNVAFIVSNKWKLEQNDLSDPALAHNFIELIRCAENGNSAIGGFDLFVADQSKRAQSEIRLASQPVAELGRSMSGTDEQSFLIADTAEKAAHQKLRQVMMRKEQGDVEPRHKIEKENARDKSVFCPNGIKNEHAHAGNGLTQAEPMLPEQFILHEIIF